MDEDSILKNLHRLSNRALRTEIVLCEIGFTRTGVNPERARTLMRVAKRLTHQEPVVLILWREPEGVFRSRLNHDLRADAQHPLHSSDSKTIDLNFVESMHNCAQLLTCTYPYCLREKRSSFRGMCAGACARYGFRQTDPARLTPASVAQVLTADDIDVNIAFLPLELLQTKPIDYWKRVAQTLGITDRISSDHFAVPHSNYTPGESVSLSQKASEWITDANGRDVKWLRQQSLLRN